MNCKFSNWGLSSMYMHMKQTNRKDRIRGELIGVNAKTQDPI